LSSTGFLPHKAKSVQRYLETVRHRLKLFFLLPYAPEINPDEVVCNDVKNNGIGLAMIGATTNLSGAVNSRLRLLKRNPDKVRSE